MSVARSTTFGLLGLSLLLGACSSGLEQETPALAPQAAQTLRVPITSGANDAEGTTSAVTSGKALDFAQNGQTVGLRFTGVNIPQGATITGAAVHFTAITADAAPIDLRVYGVDADNAAPFSGAFSTSRTSASVPWQPKAWTVGMTTPRTADLKAVVQEIVSRGGWRSGNALAFLVVGEGSAKRSANAYDKSPASAPYLSVTFTPPSGSTPAPQPSSPPPPPGPVSGTCLEGSAPLLSLSGDHNKTVYVRNKSTGVRIDARNARLLAPVGGTPSLSTDLNAGSLCLSGGLLDVGGLSDQTDWDTFHNAHGLLFYRTPNVVVENLTTLEVGDGIAFKNDNPNWLFRDSYVRHAGDDGVENDRFNSGTVDDVLIDWAYTGVSCRKESVAPRDTLFTIRNTLIALRPQNGTYGEYTRGEDNPNLSGHGELFKMTKKTGTGCRLVLQNNVFLISRSAGYVNPNDDPAIGYDPLVTAACDGRKNTIVYAGTDTWYLNNRLKTLDPRCFTVTTDLGVWQAARNRWFDRHPQFQEFRNREPQGEAF